MYRLSQSPGIRYHLIQYVCVSLFILLQCHYPNEIATSANFLFGGQREIDGSWNKFLET